MSHTVRTCRLAEVIRHIDEGLVYVKATDVVVVVVVIVGVVFVAHTQALPSRPVHPHDLRPSTLARHVRLAVVPRDEVVYSPPQCFDFVFQRRFENYPYIYIYIYMCVSAENPRQQQLYSLFLSRIYRQDAPRQ